MTQEKCEKEFEDIFSVGGPSNDLFTIDDAIGKISGGNVYTKHGIVSVHSLKRDELSEFRDNIANDHTRMTIIAREHKVMRLWNE